MAKNLEPTEKTLKLEGYQSFWLYDLLSDRDLTGYPNDVVVWVDKVKKELRT